MGMQQRATSAKQTRPVIGGVNDLTAGDLVSESATDRCEPVRAQEQGSDGGAALAGALIGIERLRALHHRIARTLAGFDGNVPAAAAVLGMDPARIRNLKGNPAFVELVAFYRDRGDEVILDLKARMELLAHDSLAELHERLIGEPETSLTNSELKDLVESLLDRLGHAPVQKGVVANVNLSREEFSDLMHGAGRVKVLEDVREAGAPDRALGGASGPGPSPTGPSPTGLKIVPSEGNGSIEPDRTEPGERNPSL